MPGEPAEAVARTALSEADHVAVQRQLLAAQPRCLGRGEGEIPVGRRARSSSLNSSVICPRSAKRLKTKGRLSTGANPARSLTWKCRCGVLLFPAVAEQPDDLAAPHLLHFADP